MGLSTRTNRGAIWWIGASLVAAASPTQGTLPNATLDALRALWEQTGGEQWTRCQWTPDLDPCAPPWGLPHWTEPVATGSEAWGLPICFVCNSSGTPPTLLGLDLGNNALRGTIPPSLGRLTSLRFLSLAANLLSGSIPESLGSLGALTQLGLYDNQLTGAIPPSLGNLTRLTYLGLFNNRLTGAIPGSLSSLTQLESLGLGSCRLSGAIPEWLGQLVHLNYLALFNNRLTGTIPASLGGLTALAILGLDNNGLTGEIQPLLGRLTSLTFLSLENNELTGAIPGSLGNLTRLTQLALGSNQLTGAIPESLGNLTALFYLGLFNNRLSGQIPAALGTLTALTFLGLFENQLTGAIPNALGNMTALTIIALNNNRLSGGIPPSLANLRRLTALHLHSNNLTDALLGAPRWLAAFQGSLTVSLSGNNIRSTGRVFEHCTNENGVLMADLSDNQIGDSFLESALPSASRCAAQLILNLQNNSISRVRFSTLVNYTVRYCGVDPCQQTPQLDLIIDLSHNPVEHFGASQLPLPPLDSYQASYTNILAVDLSHSTRPLQLASFDGIFDRVPWNLATGGTLNISLAGNPTVPLSIVRDLSGASNSPMILRVNLSWNNYTEVGSGELSGSYASSIDLSHNALTRIADDAVEYNFALTSLHLSWNHLTLLSSKFLDRLSGLTDLTVDHNALTAVPVSNNHLAGPANANSNPLQCTSYGPTATDCTCRDGTTPSTFCGYVRCIPPCPLDSFFNSSDCSHAPWPSCVSDRPASEYYNKATQSFLPIVASCATAFRGSSGVTLQGFEFAAPTLTTNRQCSICSTCPSGFDTLPCTATTDTKCTQGRSLSPADIASIVLSVVLLLIAGLVGLGYGRTQKKQRHQTQTELELTERLLGDVQDEKERAIEEIADMEHAWAIAENDLGFGAVIGEGAYGRVFRGTWGHIPVAIKVLRHPLDEMDPAMRVDFDREVKFMRSIRHPHILIFYGAGVDSDSRAFLVTELMAGSLRTLLLNHQTPLSWETRLIFASDIASGMAYLHDRGTVHRDLKADNCFLSENNRVKVADFGTGRLAKQIHDNSIADTATTEFSDGVSTTLGRADVGRTLSKGVGSLLWMAPEALRGARLRDGQGPALDVYSYAIVLWEIWARARPWDEVQEEGVQFSERLTELVNAGVRPQLPAKCEAAPEGYQTLMEQCWSGEWNRRPSFAAILQSLSAMSI